MTRGRPPHADILTPAEWRVVEFVLNGLSNRQIAERQGVSMDVVKFRVANALAKLGLESRAKLRVWTGVRGDSQLSRREIDMDASVSLGTIGQIARAVSDVAAARTWYGDVLGIRHLYSFGNLAFFDCRGVRLFLSEGEGSPP